MKTNIVRKPNNGNTRATYTLEDIKQLLQIHTMSKSIPRKWSELVAIKNSSAVNNVAYVGLKSL